MAKVVKKSFQIHLRLLVLTLLRVGLRTSTKNFNPESQEGFRILSRIAFRHRAVVLLALTTSAASVFFEGWSIVMLAFAVKVLMGSGPIIVSEMGLPSLIADQTWVLYFEQYSRGQLFIILVLVAIVSQLLRSGITYVNALAALTLRRRASQQLQETITNKITTLSYESVTQISIGNQMEKIRLGHELSLLILTANSICLAVSLISIYVCSMLVLSTTLTIIAVCLALTLSVVLTRIVKLMRKLGDSTTGALLNLGHKTINYLNAPRLVRLFCSERYVSDIVNQQRRTYLLLGERAARITASINPSIEVLTITGAGLFLILGYFFSGESLNQVIPSIMLFLVILNRVMPQVQIINKARIQVANKLKVMEEIVLLLMEEEKENRTVDKTYSFDYMTKNIEFRNVDFSYTTSSSTALSNISFRLEKGKTLALIGGSGAGKSTLADLLLGLLKPTKGSIRVDDRDLQTIDMKDWRKSIGVVDQEAFLLNASVLENILFGRVGYTKKNVEDVARLSQAHEFIENLENRYDTVVGDRGYFLSGGQRQRIAIARALLSNPEFLVLDEATSALDIESEKLLRETLRDLNGLRTVVLISHRFSTVSEADEILVLDQGKIVEKGSRAELNVPGTYFYNMWEHYQTGDSEYVGDLPRTKGVDE